jgi:hypothetical protein
MNFHIEGCLTTTDWFHALWKPEEKNEKTIISNFILMKTSVDAVNRGDVPPSRHRKWRNVEARIQRLKREYNTGVRNFDDFWSAVSKNEQNHY